MEKIIENLKASVAELRAEKNPSPHQAVTAALLDAAILRLTQHVADTGARTAMSASVPASSEFPVPASELVQPQTPNPKPKTGAAPASDLRPPTSDI